MVCECDQAGTEDRMVAPYFGVDACRVPSVGRDSIYRQRRARAVGRGCVQHSIWRCFLVYESSLCRTGSPRSSAAVGAPHSAGSVFCAWDCALLPQDAYVMNMPETPTTLDANAVARL